MFLSAPFDVKTLRWFLHCRHSRKDICSNDVSDGQIVSRMWLEKFYFLVRAVVEIHLKEYGVILLKNYLENNRHSTSKKNM